MRWRCKKKKDIFFCCLWASLILYPLPSSLPLLFYSSRWLRDSIPAIFCPCRNSRTHQRERGWEVGGVGEAETVRETEGRGEDARGRLWHKRHFIAQTRFQRINTNIPVTLCWYCRRMYGVAQSHSSSGVQVSVGAELTKPWPLHSCRHLQSELNPSYDVK